jgi:DNA replication licensing factor MCM2
MNRCPSCPVTASQAEAVDLDLTEEDIEHIRTLAKDPQIGERLVNSIAPAIYGWHNIKLALALAMFGGEAKVQPTKKACTE